MEKTNFDKYVIFEIGKEIYAINILYVDRIVDEQYIRPVPNTKEFVKGIINVKGKDVSSNSDGGIKDIAPVIDLRIKFNIESDKIDKEPYIIISRINDIVVGLIVDNVIDIIEIHESELSGKLDESISVGALDYIQNFYRKKNEETKEEELYIIINMNKLLEVETMEELKDLTE